MLDKHIIYIFFKGYASIYNVYKAPLGVWTGVIGKCFNTLSNKVIYQDVLMCAC